MRVDVEQERGRFRYHLVPEADDRREAKRGFADAPIPFALARTRYTVEVPPSFEGLHPDLHAAAIWHVVKPLVGSRLELPFAVSRNFADAMNTEYQVEFPHNTSAQPPRAAPPQKHPCLLFSGGMDSAAASVVFPGDTDHLFLDRIPHARVEADEEALLDLARQRDACLAVEAMGRRVHRTRDDHEHLFEPYPLWHSDMPLLSGLYMADSLGVEVLDTGEVLDAVSFRGYHRDEPEEWRFRPQGKRTAAAGDHGPDDDPAYRFLRFVGLSRAESISGLSEVATTLIVARSPLRGRSFSCYYRSDGFFCMRCDKCFKKLMLRHIADGEPIPGELVESFLSIPRIASIFARPYFDWHHVWYYIFQQARSDHPFLLELGRQTRHGPDLSMLARWYPPSRDSMEGAYRDRVLEGILRYVEPMSDEEVRALEAVDVPPLAAPTLQTKAVSSRSAARPDLEVGADVLAIQRALQKWLTLAPAADLAGAEVIDIRASAGSQGVSVVLRRRGADDGDRLVVKVRRVTADSPPCFVTLGALGIGYDGADALAVPWRKAALGAFVRHLAACAGVRTRRSGPPSGGGRSLPAPRG